MITCISNPTVVHVVRPLVDPLLSAAIGAALRSLAYRPYTNPPAETRRGFVYYKGNPQNYNYWVFRTDLRMAVAKKGEKP